MSRTRPSIARQRVERVVCVIAIAPLMACVITACASGDRAHETQQAAGRASLDSGRIMAPEFASLANSEQVEKRASARVGDSVPWAVIASDANSNSLFVAYVKGSTAARCGEHLGIEVVETSTSVTIAAVSTAPSSSKTCLASPAISGGRVDLASPLGSRSLLHAPLSAPWVGAPSPLKTVAAPSEGSTPLVLQYSGSATCASLLSGPTIAKFRAAGLADDSETWSDNIAKQPDLREYDFLRLGGLLCDWRHGPEVGRGYGYGPLSSSQAKSLESDLVASGFTSSVGANGVIRVVDEKYHRRAFAFGSGYWAGAFDTGEGGDLAVDVVALVNDVVANVPVTR